MLTPQNHPDDAQRRREEAYLSRKRKEAEAEVDLDTPTPPAGIEDPKYSQVNDRQKKTLLDLLGKDIVRAMQDPYTQDVMLNENGTIFQDRLGTEPFEIGILTYSEATAIVTYIAGCFNMVLNERRPILSCELPLWTGPRIECQVPPVVAAPTFTIRKPAIRIYTLEDYVDQGVITPEQRTALNFAVRERKNILVIGGTKSGKTTFVNAIIHEMCRVSPNDRQIIIEDTREIRSICKNKVNFCTCLDVEMQDLLKTTLRMSPDRIIVGEVRGPEAHDLIQAWNTGHPGGASTIHADDCESALDRLADLIATYEYAPPNPHKNIARAVHVLVNIQKDPENPPACRRVKDIKVIDGWSETAGYTLKSI